MSKRPYRLVQGTERLRCSNFALELGGSLPEVDVRYAIYGEPNELGDNVTLVCHALSGSSRVDQWWPLLLESVFDLERDCVVCTNVIGSCYGSTGPSSIDPRTGKAYGPTFPHVTPRDMVRAQAIALEQLGITHLRNVIGSSLGGMQALHWAIDYADRVERCVLIGASPLNSFGIALNHLQRKALATRTDDGLSLARQIGMLSYKSPELFEERHSRRPDRFASGLYDVAGYLEYQGRKFVERFDLDSYETITHAMDAFHPETSYGSAQLAYERISASLLLIGISSDLLFPAADVRALANRLADAGADATYREIVSDHGHDAFLAEPEKLVPLLTAFLERPSVGRLSSAASTGTFGDRNGNRR